VGLDQVKTQVLLLHSEQSTLDSLSAGIDDRYTVHCATSGIEALNTLGVTPIHVIISAKDLPGMSGVDALREAKKRSPDTIGILLAGNDDKDIEALVGEKEVFQIVRGLRPEDLGSIIDNATRQMRLMALAESANDVAANPDEPSGEHIIMETSENGSTIISDGTGRMPALNPQRVAASTSSGARGVDVLVLSKDEEFLATVKDSTAGLHNIRSANTLALAEEALVKHKIGVVVVDAAMVGSNAEKLTQHLQKKSARLVSIVAGRRDDGDMLMDLINRGKVYRFLLKPVSPGRARLAIEASVKHHLEAPDSAFKLVAGAAPAPKATTAKAPRPATKAPTRPAGKTPPKPAENKPPKPVDKARSKPAGGASNDAPRTAPKAKPKPKSKAPSKPAAASAPSVDGDRLSDAFGGDDKSFTETVTGLVANVGDRLSSKSSKPASGDAIPESFTVESEGGGWLSGPKLVGIAAVAVAVLAAGGYLTFSGSDDVAPANSEPETVADERPEVAETADEPGVATREVSAPPSADELLDEARLARTAGRIFRPEGDNAIELYTAARRAAPGNEAIAAELAETITEALALTEQALLDRRVGDAAVAIERIGFADPENARLPFLSAQLAQLQLREYVEAARASIRNGRFESAAGSLAAARALGLADTSEIDSAAEELAAARSEQQVDDVLSRAAERFDAGDLLSPANDNARYYYRLVLDSEPNNSAALQGLKAVAAALVLRARNEVDAGRYDAAAALLDDARALDPNSADLAASSQALIQARESAERDRRAAAAAEEARQAAAEEEARQTAAAETARQAAVDAAATEPATAANENPGQDELADDGVMGPEAPADTPDQATAEGPEVAGPPAAEPAAEETIVGISSLNRTRYVAPRYPRSAERRNLSGWVDVVFTVSLDGSVSNVEVRESDPEDVFDTAAVRAVERWEFEPVFENGVAVEKRAGVRLMFAIE